MINRKWVQTKKTQLYTSIGSTATSILLKNAFRLDGGLLDMEDDFGAIGFMTIEPGGLKEEIISFTGLSYNLSGTILTLSGVTRGRKGEHPYTTGGTAYGHSANRVAIFTNNPQHYEGFANKYNEETITQVWTFTETERPKLDVDRDALLAEELITLGQVNRLIQATYLPPQIVASDSGTTGTSQAASLTIPHTIPANTQNGGTYVVINTEENKTVSTVTLGGTPLTRVATQTRVTGNLREEIWRLLAPTAGTANLVITPSANAYITADVITFSNVNQTTPEDAISTGANGSGTAPADSITTTTQGAVILVGVGTANDPTVFTPTAPLAEQEVTDSGATRLLSSSVRSTTTAGVYALAYTISPSQNYVIKGLAIRGIAVPGIAGVSSVTGNYINNTDPSNPVSEVPLNNTTTTNPTVNDDESLGYYVDSKWFNSVTGVLWTCTDATTGAAVWVAASSNNSSLITVNTVDDFINWIEIVDSNGDPMYISGNFYFGDFANVLSTETNHPGVITIPEGLGNGADVIGFIAAGNTTAGNTGGKGLIPVGNDFTFTFIGESTRTGASFEAAIGLTDDSAGYDVYVRFSTIQSSTKVTYYVGAGPVVSTIDLPVSGDWFTLVFDYVAATTTLTITLDGQTVFSGTPTFADTQVGFRYGNVGGTSGTHLKADLVTCTYKATR